MKGESINACIQRVAREELGIKIEPKNAKLLGVFEDVDKDPKGHVVDIVYGYEEDGSDDYKKGEETQEIKFFSNIPKVGVTHGEILKKLGYE